MHAGVTRRRRAGDHHHEGTAPTRRCSGMPCGVHYAVRVRSTAATRLNCFTWPMMCKVKRKELPQCSVTSCQQARLPQMKNASSGVSVD